MDVELRKAELREIIQKQEALQKEYELTHRIEFWLPWPHQQKAVDFVHAGKKQILVQGANRIGKSALGANITGAACLGFEPWTKEKVLWLPPPPIKARIICVDWEHHAREVIVPTLYEWLPQGTFTTKKNNVGVEAYWDFENGSSIELLTHGAETRASEGWKGHIVWSDEPMPKDKYIVNLRGLIDYSGVFLMTMTAIYEPWILDEMVLAGNPAIGLVLEVPMRANPLLNDQDIENFSLSCRPEERAARVSGKWLQMQGLIFKQYSEKNDVNDFKVPPHWPVVALIDLHLSKEQAVAFYAFDEYNRIFVVDEIWEHLAPEEIADEIIRRKKRGSLRLRKAFIDPLAKGDAAYVKNRFKIEDSYTIIEKRLHPFGISLDVASKDKQSGILNIQNRLAGLNGMPTLFFTNKAVQHKYEIRRWIYDKNTGKPRDEDDHMMENLYRVTLTGVKYMPPDLYSKPLDFGKTGVV